MLRPTIALAAFLLAATPIVAPAYAPANAQDVGQTIDVGGWKVRRTQANPTTQTCVAVQQADDKTAVGFGVTSQGQAFLMLIDPGGKMKSGQDVALEYKVDAAKTTKVAATAANPSTLVATLGTINDVSPFYTAVENGNDIHLETAESTFDYSLKGSKAALAALGTCLQAAMAN